MDEFVVDLDKVLDDFEATLDKNEDFPNAATISQQNHEEANVCKENSTCIQQSAINANNSLLYSPSEPISVEHVQSTLDAHQHSNNLLIDISPQITSCSTVPDDAHYQSSGVVDLDQLLNDFQGALQNNSGPSVQNEISQSYDWSTNHCAENCPTISTMKSNSLLQNVERRAEQNVAYVYESPINDEIASSTTHEAIQDDRLLNLSQTEAGASTPQQGSTDNAVPNVTDPFLPKVDICKTELPSKCEDETSGPLHQQDDHETSVANVSHNASDEPRKPPTYDEAIQWSLVLSASQQENDIAAMNITNPTTEFAAPSSHHKDELATSQTTEHISPNDSESSFLRTDHGTNRDESSYTVRPPTTDFYHLHFDDSPETTADVDTSPCIQNSASCQAVLEEEETGNIPSAEATEPSQPFPSPAATVFPISNEDPETPQQLSSSDEKPTVIRHLEPAPQLNVPVCAWNGGLLEHQVGLMEPKWAPDNSSPLCMVCGLKFTVIRRRHHCRACGQLLCSACCNWWMPLVFLDGAKARVCACCYQLLVRLESSNMRQNQLSQEQGGSSSSPTSATNLVASTTSGAPVSALKRSRVSPTLLPTATSITSTDTASVEPSLSISKSVCFSDGVRPGRDLKEMLPGAGGEPPKSSPPILSPRSSKDRLRASNVNMEHSRPTTALMDSLETCYLPNWNEEALKGITNVDVPLPLPPVVQMLPEGIKFQMLPDLQGVVEELSSANVTKCSFEVRFALSSQCHVRVSRWKMRPHEQGPIAWKNSDASDFCWRFISQGMQSVGQQEIVLLLECPPEEILPPMAVMRLFYQLYVYAQRTDVTGHASPIHELACYVPSSISGGSSVDRLPFPCGAAVLFVTLRHLATFVRSTSTWQSSLLRDLPSDCVLGLLIHECELVWARLLPQRVLYRMGMAAQCYPHPLLSQRYRASLFGDVGHTLFRLLADFQSYRYTVHTVAGLTISLFPDGLIKVEVPKSSYGQIMRVLNERADDSSVLAFGAVFNMAADSHLTCVQNTDTDQYSTEAITASSGYPQVTGASFVVFNGGQRNIGGSLVEDGVLVQMSSTQFQELLLSLTGMRDFVMKCPSTASPHTSPLRKIALMENAGAGPSKPPVHEDANASGSSQGLLQIIWLEDDADRLIDNAPLTRSSWIDGRALVVDNGYTGPTFGHSGCVLSPEVSYRVPTDYRLRHCLNALVEMGGIDLSDRTRDKVYGVAFVRLFVLQCPSGCEDRGTREPVDPLHICEPIAEAFIKFLLPFAEVASSCNVTGIALRVLLDPELVGYTVGCCNWCDERLLHGLPECCTMEGSLDDALIPVVHPAASRIVHGPLELELMFYLVPL